MHIVYVTSLLTLYVGACTCLEEYNCTCGHYDEYNVGPFCERWSGSAYSFCLLSGDKNASLCPGALQWKNTSIYYTRNKKVCSKTNSPKAVPWSLSVRPAFTVKDIVGLSFYSLLILLGTVGNVLVVNYFAFGNASDRPGSRFVVILAVVDFVSSIWVPVQFILRTLYRSLTLRHWPFGKALCHIGLYYPILFSITPWLLVAISVERARAVYKPFAGRLSVKFVLLSLTVILIYSFALVLKWGLSVEYKVNLPTYVNGVFYRYHYCGIQMSEREKIINTFTTFTLGIWIPMLLIDIVYVLVYLKLKREARLREQSSTLDSQAQLTRISHTFTLVLAVFYICYLPWTIQYTVYKCLQYFKIPISWDALFTADIFTQSLLISNNCLNPIIYSKLHRRVFKFIQKLIITLRERCLCATTPAISQSTTTIDSLDPKDHETAL